jgi:hypothetical protein
MITIAQRVSRQISRISGAAAMTTTAFILSHDIDEVASFIVELTERTPARDRSIAMFNAAVERKFPGLDIDQLHAAQEIAATTLKATR